MPKVIQPLSNSDDIRDDAEESVKEKFTDYYVDAAAPDPLTWQPPAVAASPQTQQGVDDSAQTVAEMSQANDPLQHQTAQPTNAQIEAAEDKAVADLAQQNDPLKTTD